MRGQMPHLSPATLTHGEQMAILGATASNVRDHLIYSLALGTGLRLAEIVGLNVGDLFALDGTPRSRVRVRAEIAKGGRSGDIFLPTPWVLKLRKFWRAHLTRNPSTKAYRRGDGAAARVPDGDRPRVLSAWRVGRFDSSEHFSSFAVASVWRARRRCPSRFNLAASSK